jgi:uncharacterized membrane protein (DUF2068 family)
MIFNHSHGVRAVAVFEALKGLIVLIAGFGLFSLMHRDVQAIAERLVRYSHLNLARRYPQIFLEAISHIDDSKLRFLAALAFVYAALRLVEAYGLWRMRTWAQWYAIITGAVYVPIELYRVFKHLNLLGVLVLFINIFIVGFMAYHRRHRKSETA